MFPKASEKASQYYYQRMKATFHFSPVSNPTGTEVLPVLLCTEFNGGGCIEESEMPNDCSNQFSVQIKFNSQLITKLTVVVTFP